MSSSHRGFEEILSFQSELIGAKPGVTSRVIRYYMDRVSEMHQRICFIICKMYDIETVFGNPIPRKCMPKVRKAFCCLLKVALKISH